ncbi:MAG: hypothetical protein L6Q98_19000 [Anaerolineae bacterium]|nr:hypothetical protein [Anaerolineae bacterium]NUQ05450.1 hypothetical protein [Anaerolineae bacterium]
MAVESNTQDAAAPPQTVEQEDERDWGAPRGAAAFTALMLIGYVIYLVYMWLTVMSRG